MTSRSVTEGIVDLAALPLSRRYDVALVDLDGVVYVGPQVIGDAPDALAAARAAGMRIAFVTNNASRTPETVAAQLAELGIPAQPDDVVTSAQAAAHLVADKLGKGASVLVTGTAGLRAIVIEAGLRAVDTADERPDAVVQGFSPTLGYADLVEATVAVRGGALWVATNADSTIPSPRGLLPGNGSLVGVVMTATGRRPIVAGKPELPLHAEAVQRTAAARPLVVGDRLDTDIQGANAAHTDSLLVLTGVTDASDLIDVAQPYRPTFVDRSLRALGRAHPPVEQDRGQVRCGGWTARIERGAVALAGAGEPGDGLRAVLAIAWSQRDANREVDASAAIAQLGMP